MSTTTSTSETPETTPASVRRAVFPRLGSALALIPLGVWTTFHIWDNLYAWRGAAAWEGKVTAARPPLVEIITSTVVLLPLVLHTVWGIRRLTIMKPNLGRYRTFENLKFVIQRLSAIGLLAFIPAHIWMARLSPLIAHGRHETFADISWHMRNHAPTLIVYVLGTLGTAYHLANGLATAGMTWGFAASPRAARRMNTISLLAFVALLAMSWGALYALWDAGAGISAPARSVQPQ